MFDAASHDGLLLFVLSSSVSLLNHSCDPNCSIVFNGPHLLLRAVRDIEAGEEVRNPRFPLLVRQRPCLGSHSSHQRCPRDSFSLSFCKGKTYNTSTLRPRYLPLLLPGYRGANVFLITIFLDDDSSFCMCDRMYVLCAYDSSVASSISASHHLTMGKKGSPA